MLLINKWVKEKIYIKPIDRLSFVAPMGKKFSLATAPKIVRKRKPREKKPGVFF